MSHVFQNSNAPRSSISMSHGRPNSYQTLSGTGPSSDRTVDPFPDTRGERSKLPPGATSFTPTSTPPTERFSEFMENVQRLNKSFRLLHEDSKAVNKMLDNPENWRQWSRPTVIKDLSGALSLLGGEYKPCMDENPQMAIELRGVNRELSRIYDIVERTQLDSQNTLTIVESLLSHKSKLSGSEQTAENSVDCDKFLQSTLNQMVRLAVEKGERDTQIQSQQARISALEEELRQERQRSSRVESMKSNPRREGGSSGGC